MNERATGRSEQLSLRSSYLAFRVPTGFSSASMMPQFGIRRRRACGAVALLIALIPAPVAAGEARTGDAPGYAEPLAASAVPQQNRPVRIISVYGARALVVGREENYRVRVNDGAAWPINYRWSMGDGTLAQGNNVVHAYSRPGRYRVIVTARNARGVDTDSIFVNVTSPPRASIPLESGAEERSRAAAAATGGAGGGSAEPAKPARNAAPASSESPLRSAQGIEWGRGGFTLLVSNYFDREAAENRALALRREGYRVGIMVDDKNERASTAYRVVIGQFFSEDSAAKGRTAMLDGGVKGSWTVFSLDGYGATP